MSVLVFLFCTLYLCCIAHDTKFDLKQCSQIVQNRTICKVEENYETNEPPKPLPLKVRIKIHLVKVVDFDSVLHTATIFAKMMSFWNDTRITMTNIEPNYAWKMVPEEIKDELFFPKIGFFNIKSITKQLDYGVGNQEYFWMEHPHSFEYREVIKVTSYCHFNFQSFPFDQHECEFSFGVDIFSIRNVLLQRPEIHYEGAMLPATVYKTDEKSERSLPFDISVESIDPFNSLINGWNYSATGIKIHLKRNSVGFLIGIQNLKSYMGILVSFIFNMLCH